MKIEPTIATRLAGVQKPAGRNSRASGGPEGGSTVALSSSARFVQDLRDSVSTTPTIRAEVVEQAKADIAAGRLGSEAEIDAALDSLLAGF